eukprot:5711-Heterococcus_DN1.PRE.5
MGIPNFKLLMLQHNDHQCTIATQCKCEHTTESDRDCVQWRGYTIVARHVAHKLLMTALA